MNGIDEPAIENGALLGGRTAPVGLLPGEGLAPVPV